MRAGIAIIMMLLLAACARIVPAGSAPRPAPAPPVAASSASAVMAGLALGPAISALGVDQSAAARALASFRESCPQLLRRTDASGLTTSADWQAPCEAARNWRSGRERDFFTAHFDAVQVGDGSAFATGYYEPEIAGSRTRRRGYEVPVYAMPNDLVRGWPDDVPASQRQGQGRLGRYDERGRFVLYHERAEIDRGALNGKAAVLAYAADPVELFFLQIQGSGRLRTPEGEIIRIGYAGQNGREYVGIGSVMRERGLIGTGRGQYSGSMQGIMAYIRENPREGRDLMHLNKSWVFFRELTGDGPLGAMGVPVRRGASVAADPAFVPLGAPVVLTAMDRRETNGLWIAQDTGGAIKGANRFDTFWGAGDEARAIAGGMSARGRALVLLPKGVAARHRAGR